MAIETITNIRANVSGGESVKSIRQELSKAREEAINLSREFGALSPEATEAAQKVALIKDELGDLNKRVASLDPNKFSALSNMGANIAKGFAGAQGAMALFGAESEDVQRQLLKVQGAMAFAEGLESIGTLKKQFGTLASTIGTTVVKSFTTLGGAARALGAATGLGLIVTAVTLLINNFGKVKDAVNGLINKFPFLGKVISAVTDTVKAITEWFTDLTDAIGLTNSALDAQVESYDAVNKAAQERIELMEAEGASEEELYFARKKALIDEINQLKTQKDKKEELSAKEFELKKLYASNSKRVRDEEEKAEQDVAKKREDRLANQLKQQEERAEKQRQFIEQNKKDIEDAYEMAMHFQEIFDEARTNAIKADQEAVKTDIEEKQDFFKKDYAGREARRLLDIKNQKEAAQAEIKNKEDIFNASQNLATNLTALVGEQTKLGKGIALAQIGADTAKALTAALANSQSPTPENVASGGLAGIAKYVVLAANILGNAARAKRVLQGGGTGGAAPTAAAPASFNFTATQLRQPTTPQSFADGRVYVLESDISGTQRRVRTNRQVSVF
jgi:DNA segregation ATPase FtsK/SpoIIIE-like protein